MFNVFPSTQESEVSTPVGPIPFLAKKSNHLRAKIYKFLCTLLYLYRYLNTMGNILRLQWRAIRVRIKFDYHYIILFCNKISHNISKGQINPFHIEITKKKRPLFTTLDSTEFIHIHDIVCLWHGSLRRQQCDWQF